MNFQEYQNTLEQLEDQLARNLSFWEVRRFIPGLFVSGNQLYLSEEASADGMDSQDLLQFIRCMIQFGGYTQEEVFNAKHLDSSDDLGTSEDGDDAGEVNSQALLANGLEPQPNGVGQSSVQLFADEHLYYP
jgi:hypothetical protein